MEYVSIIFFFWKSAIVIFGKMCYYMLALIPTYNASYTEGYQLSGILLIGAIHSKVTIQKTDS